jgi:immunomodulating metalloprotease
VTIDQPTLMVNAWTTTGLFAMPGQPITVRRVDGNSAVVRAYLRFWFQRQPTTKAFNLEPTRPLSTYNRPQFVQSPRVLLPSDGSPIVLSAPFGGPIYLQMENLLPNGGANNGRFNVTVVLDNVAKHPTILDMANDTEVAEFANILLTSRLPAIDMRADGLEVHARKDKLTDGLRVYGFNSLINYTGGAEGVQRLVDDYRFRFVEQQYTLAGFKAPGALWC